MQANVIMNGHITGTKRPVRGMENLGFYEVWNGLNWVSEEIWNRELDSSKKGLIGIVAEDECEGCDSPFCSDCAGVDKKGKTIKEIKKLIKLQEEVTVELKNRLSELEVMMMGGDIK